MESLIPLPKVIRSASFNATKWNNPVALSLILQVVTHRLKIRRQVHLITQELTALAHDPRHIDLLAANLSR
ncbi:MAG: hypothetical protein OSB05_09850 [Akkermansiaceae bacterium]|nr:hypothetical protein [Akkermansiaceae bacterium]